MATDSQEVSSAETEHFKPVGTVFILVMFVITLLILWGSVYLILISRGMNT